MLYSDKFNVFMQDYGDETVGGGGGNGDSVANLGIDDPFSGFTFTPSRYLFTDPPRYFKANDPYYYEVDNIPLKQIQENCLWLRDQMVGLELNVTGVPLSKVLDLQPSVSNSNRIVRVHPGKFMARVNDAYGLSELFSQIDDSPVVDITRPTIYDPPSMEVNNIAFSIIIGETIADLFYSNGLYNQLQTHTADIKGDYASTGGIIEINYDPFFLDEAPLLMSKIPKIKTAVWQQLSSSLASLQQKAVDFTRRWQGVFRTAVVNVNDPLSVEIPPFSVTDFLDNTSDTYDPQVRIDLVFVYTHPIDKATSYLAKNIDGGPEPISVPRLGVVKGAGQILSPRGGALDITGGEGIGSASWNAQTSLPNRYYQTSATLEPGQDMAIQAPLADQIADNVTNPPFPGKTTGLSFPSPDDLLNLAPIIAQGAADSTYITVGQSVLPICYVIVRKDATVLLETDIIDIRPFLRTAELAYNERAGIGAANPPLSMVNPATGKEELYHGLEVTRDYLIDLQDQMEQRFVDLFNANIIIPQAKVALAMQENITGNLKRLEVQTASHIYNTPTTGMSTDYTEVNGGKVFEENIEDKSKIKVVPGRYLIEGTVGGYYTNSPDDGTASWDVSIMDGDVVIYPTGATKLRFLAYRDHGSHNNEESGAVGISTIVDIHPDGGNPDDGADGLAYGLLAVAVKEGGSTSQNIVARGGITITRVSNYDSTAGPMPGAVQGGGGPGFSGGD